MTSRPARTPPTPSTWSAWKWVRTSRSTRTTRSRLRQASTRFGSGPASTTSAEPGPVRTTRASPCPTSQATTCQPGGGHDGAVQGRLARGPDSTAIIRTTTAPDQTSSTSRRLLRGHLSRCPGRSRCPPRARHQGRTRAPAATGSRSVSAARRAAPPHPVGQSRAAIGRLAPTRATTATHAVARPATHASAPAPAGHTGASRVTRTPRTVAGATAGATSRFAGTATRDTCGAKSTITGAHTVCAAAGTATAWATPGGNQRPSTRAQPGATSSRAAVASTDRAKPNDRDNHGSTASSTVAATARAGTPRLGCPTARPTRATAPITAARSTLGSGRATTTKPRRAAPARASRHRRPSPQAVATIRTLPLTIATLLPDTAHRCDNPVSRIASSRSAGSPEVSPTTRPGRSPPASAGNGAAAVRRPPRSCSATRCHRGAAPVSVGGPRVTSRAPTSSPGAVRLNRPPARRRSPGLTDAQDCAPTASTGAPAAAVSPRPVTSSTVIRTSQRCRCWVQGRAGSARSRTGSPATVAATVTVAPVPARSPSSPASRTDT